VETVTSRHPGGTVQDGGLSGLNLSDRMNASKSAACRSIALGVKVSPIRAAWNLKKYHDSSPGLPAGAMAPRMRTAGSFSPGSSEISSGWGGSLGAVYSVTCSAGLQPETPTAAAIKTTNSRRKAGRDGPGVRNRIPGTRGDPAGRGAGDEAGVVR